MKGFLEYVSPTEARGWVWRPETPAEQFVVRIELNGRVLTSASATLFRIDLRDGGVGNGNHAFTAYFAKPLTAQECGRIEAVVTTEDGKRVSLPMLNAPDLADIIVREPALNRFPGYDDGSEQFPVFVLGSTRSGTTVMMRALLGAGPYEGLLEGQVLDLFPALLTTINSFFQSRRAAALEDDTLLSHVSQRFFDEGVAQVFHELIERTFKTRRWVDKTPTPDMIYGAPYLRRIWPNARFIFMKRRAYENVESRMRKFPDITFERTCEGWAHAMEAWSVVRDELHGCAIEIDQQAIASSPDRVAWELTKFLSAGHEARNRMAQILRSERPERTSLRAQHTIDPATDMSALFDPEIFEKYCGRWLDPYGYSRDTSYFQPGNTGITVL